MMGNRRFCAGPALVSAVRRLSRATVRHLTVTATAAASGGGGGARASLLVGTGLVSGVLLQTYFGTADDFYEFKYTTTKHPDDILELYQGEELLKFITLSVLGLPTLDFVLSGTSFRTEANEGWEATTDVNLLGGLFYQETSFQLTEEEEVLDDGSSCVGFFNRHETFKNYFPFTKILIWDTTWDFGYKRLGDGTTEVFHRGTRFYGPFPTRLLMFLHWTVVGYLVEKHVNSAAFGSGDVDAVEAQLANVPKHLLQQYVASLRGEVEKKAVPLRARTLSMHPAVKEQLAAYERTIAQLRTLEKTCETRERMASIAKETTLKRRTTIVGDVPTVLKLQRRDTVSADNDDVIKRSKAQLRIDDVVARRTIQAAITQIVDSDAGVSAIALATGVVANSPELVYKEDKKATPRLQARVSSLTKS